ncbi:hypothetical protein FRC18_003599 [Serendipita sp. 400]|nr:hypothetical protein FRC18_003599 [Serendipita sp. 400]
MRAKDFWTAFPLPEKLNVLRSRITRTKWTKVFFFLALIHCVIQIGLQAGAYTISSQMSAPFSKVMDMSLVAKPFAILEKNGDLTLCSDMPQRFGGSDPCTTRISFLSDGAGNKAGEDDYEDEEYEDDHDDKKLRRRFSVSPNLSSNGTVVGVTLIGLDPEQPRSRQVVSARCVATFPWIFDVLHDNAREDIVFIFYQVWLFCASLFAIAYESIPHLYVAPFPKN